jgi:hypothetical protein
MADAQPTMTLGDVQATRSKYEAPTQPPPIQATAASAQPAAPTASSPPAPAAPPQMQAAPTLPTLASAIAGVSTWQSNKNVDGLWTINQDGNSWMGVAGIGWKKLAHANETSLVALTMLAGHARATNATINYREEADGMVHEIYVW